jgi:hypothetical protein
MVVAVPGFAVIVCHYRVPSLWLAVRRARPHIFDFGLLRSGSPPPPSRAPSDRCRWKLGRHIDRTFMVRDHARRKSVSGSPVDGIAMRPCALDPWMASVAPDSLIRTGPPACRRNTQTGQSRRPKGPSRRGDRHFLLLTGWIAAHIDTAQGQAGHIAISSMSSSAKADEEHRADERESGFSCASTSSSSVTR